MIKSSKKLINKTVYENNAEYPWARVKDFMLSADGKRVEKVVLVSESLIPVPYTVNFEDFETLDDKKAVLKPEVKPVAVRISKEEPKVFSNLRKFKFEKKGRKNRILDISFDTEIGEIVDFTVSPSPVGKKAYLSPDDSEISGLIDLYFK